MSKVVSFYDDKYFGRVTETVSYSDELKKRQNPRSATTEFSCPQKLFLRDRPRSRAQSLARSLRDRRQIPCEIQDIAPIRTKSPSQNLPRSTTRFEM